MELKDFVAKLVNPGEPLTAQAWNEIVTALQEANQFLKARQHSVRIEITNPDIDARTVRVTAERAGKPRVQAVAPAVSGETHVLNGLEPGSYTLRAQALGFADATQAVEVGEEDEVTVSMTLAVAQPLMPALFGVPLSTALDQLASASIPVTRVLDFAGRDLPPINPGADYLNAPVMAQAPLPGTPVSSTGARLGVAVSVQPDSAVEVPTLTSLTEDEAEKALTQLGLVLGKRHVLQKKP